MARNHVYRATVQWIGNRGEGTSSYRSYGRDYEIVADLKTAPIQGSSDPSFRGDGTRYNPEELLVASLSSCHMLWVLHLCADAGIVATAYTDEATGMMIESPDGSGQFTSVTLRPRMTVMDPARIEEAEALHDRAAQLCFIARSVNFPVRHEPFVTAG